MGCFFFALTGSYLRELNNIYRGEQRGTKIHKVVIGTIVGMGLYLIFMYKFIHGLNITISVALNVVCGLLGYELFTKLGSIDDIKKLSSDVAEIVKNLSIIGSFLDKIFGSKHDHTNGHDKNPKK